MALDVLARGVVAAGADALVVHARKAWLNGLSPKENRDIPPLDYDRVYRLKAALPDVPVIINGGIGERRRGCAAPRPCRWRDARARGLPGAVAAAGGRCRDFRRGRTACRHEGRVRGHDALHRATSSRRAHGCIRSRGISSAHSTACPARAPSVAIWPRTASGRAPASTCCAMRSRWSRIARRPWSRREVP